MKRFRAVVLTMVTAAGMLSATPSAQAGRDLRYVALGDSVAAGTGSRPQIADGDPGCRQSQAGYPYRYFQAKIGRVQSFDLNACWGADTGDLLTRQGAGLDNGTTLVSVTVGAEDIGFWQLAHACAPGSSTDCTGFALRSRELMTSLPGKLAEAYYRIRLAAPSARVVVAGYPVMFNATKPFGCHSWDQDRLLLLNRTVAELNSVIKTEVGKRPGFVFLAVDDVFTGHRVCDRPADQWIWPFDSRPPAESDAFHPNELGHGEGYLSRFERAASNT